MPGARTRGGFPVRRLLRSELRRRWNPTGGAGSLSGAPPQHHRHGGGSCKRRIANKSVTSQTDQYRRTEPINDADQEDHAHCRHQRAIAYDSTTSTCTLRASFGTSSRSHYRIEDARDHPSRTTTRLGGETGRAHHRPRRLRQHRRTSDRSRTHLDKTASASASSPETGPDHLRLGGIAACGVERTVHIDVAETLGSKPAARQHRPHHLRRRPTRVRLCMCPVRIRRGSVADTPAYARTPQRPAGSSASRRRTGAPRPSQKPAHIAFEGARCTCSVLPLPRTSVSSRGSPARSPGPSERDAARQGRRRRSSRRIILQRPFADCVGAEFGAGPRPAHRSASQPEVDHESAARPSQPSDQKKLHGRTRCVPSLAPDLVLRQGRR